MTIDGKSVPAPPGYNLAPTTVWRRFDGTVRLDVQRGGNWYWEEEYVP